MTKKESHLITIYPSMKWGDPCIDHQRMTAEQVAQMWWYGYTLKEIERGWPNLNRGAVLVSCWYMARYGTRTWRTRWKDWLLVAEIELWHSDYEICPMPPQKEVKDGLD